MKVILIQGAENTGKTTLCNQIDEWLQKKFIDEYFKENNEKIEKMVVTKDISLDTDFFALYDIKQIKNINHKRIIINSLSDTFKQIYKFNDFFEEHRIEKTNIVKDAINSCFYELLKGKKDKIYKKKKEYLDKISDIPISDVETQKQKIEDLEYSNKIMKRISQSYTPSQKPDLLITAIRPSDTNKGLYNKMKDILELDDLEKVNLSSKTIYSYQEDTSKDILLIQLEKTPLELIKEEIRMLFK